MLEEEHRLAVFEDRVLWKIFWPKKEDVTGECRTLRDGEFYDLYPCQIFGRCDVEE
jgi:hypothetical protein